MGGLLLLLALCVVMALASFLAGALPLSMTLTQSQLRLIASIGIGILVGTSLVVIIPEGIEAVAATSGPAHSHTPRHALSSPARSVVRWETARAATLAWGEEPASAAALEGVLLPPRTASDEEGVGGDPENAPQEQPGADDAGGRDEPARDDDSDTTTTTNPPTATHGDDGATLPTFFIGFSLIMGFALMFLIDRLPRHAAESFLARAPETRHISLDNLASSSGPAGDGGGGGDDDDDGDEESGAFLGSLAPTPRQSRSLATTVGLVIHAAADGIAMGASATTSDMKLGFVIFVAILIHKAPAAFGLTSVLLKQGLSKRAARGHLVVFSLAAPFGALSTYLALSVLGGSHMTGENGQWWTGMLLLFSAGTFLYVAMHAMQEDHGAGGHDHHHSSLNGYPDTVGLPPKKQARPGMRDTLATVVGMLLPLLTQFGHHH